MTPSGLFVVVKMVDKNQSAHTFHEDMKVLFPKLDLKHGERKKGARGVKKLGGVGAYLLFLGHLF